MISILVANTKGGCGKTTIATHLAAAFAGAGHRTALADADRQHSSLEWTRLRPGTAAPIAALDWVDDLASPARGTERLVIDGAAAMRKKHVFELVRLADVIIVPVLPSAFDQGSTAAFLDRLHELEVDPQEQEAGRHPAQPHPAAHAGGGAPAALSRPARAPGPGRPARPHDLQRGRGRRPLDLRSAGQRAPRRCADWDPLLRYVSSSTES